MQYKVVFQLHQDDPVYLKQALSQTRNARAALGSVDTEWVFHGTAVRLLTAPDASATPEEKAYRAQLDQVAFMGEARLLACANALESQKIATASLLSCIVVIPSAVGHLIRRQAEGWSYIKIGS